MIAENVGTSNDQYRMILRKYLSHRYDSFWLVNCYCPVSGLGSHKVDGVDGAHIKYFRTYGRNLVVSGQERHLLEFQET